MATNTLVTETWVAKESLRLLVSNLVFGQLVHRGFDSEFVGKKGDTAQILKPVEFESKSFTGAITVQDINEGKVDLTVDQHEDVSFEYGSAEKRLKMPDFSARYIEPAMIALAEKIDQVCAAQYKGFYSYYGVPGTTPAATANLIQARKNLQNQKAPLKGRNVVMDPDAEAEYIELFKDADKDGSTEVLREASLGKRFGLSTYMDQNIQTHTPGTLNAGAGETYAVNATVAAGLSTIVLKSSGGVLTGTLVEGDIINIAGHSNGYSVAALATAAANLITVTLVDPLTAEATVDDVVTALGIVSATGVGTPWVANMIFQRGAIALAFANLERPDGAAWSKVMHYAGFALRMVKSYNSTSKKEVLSLDVLFGAKNIDPRKGTVLVG